MPGSIGDSKPADAEAQQVADAVRPVVQEQTKKSYEVYEVLSYKTQLVAGLNFFLKVKTADNNCLHLRVYKNLQGEISFHSLQEDKGIDDEIAYF